jgi:hypothetical protein
MTLNELRNEYFHEMPLQIVYSEKNNDAGQPQWTAQFERWLTNPGHVIKFNEKAPCRHEGQDAEKCHLCGTYDENGNVIASTGYRVEGRAQYEFPVKRVLAIMSRGKYGKVDFGALLRHWFNTQSLESLCVKFGYATQQDAQEALAKALDKFNKYYLREPKRIK